MKSAGFRVLYHNIVNSISAPIYTRYILLIMITHMYSVYNNTTRSNSCALSAKIHVLLYLVKHEPPTKISLYRRAFGLPLRAHQIKLIITAAHTCIRAPRA